jgi:hypothetical protein
MMKRLSYSPWIGLDRLLGCRRHSSLRAAPAKYSLAWNLALDRWYLSVIKRSTKDSHSDHDHSKSNRRIHGRRFRLEVGVAPPVETWSSLSERSKAATISGAGTPVPDAAAVSILNAPDQESNVAGPLSIAEVDRVPVGKFIEWRVRAPVVMLSLIFDRTGVAPRVFNRGTQAGGRILQKVGGR